MRAGSPIGNDAGSGKKGLPRPNHGAERAAVGYRLCFNSRRPLRHAWAQDEDSGTVRGYQALRYFRSFGCELIECIASPPTNSRGSLAAEPNTIRANLALDEPSVRDIPGRAVHLRR